MWTADLHTHRLMDAWTRGLMENLVMYRLCSWEMNYGYSPKISLKV